MSIVELPLMTDPIITETGSVSGDNDIQDEFSDALAEVFASELNGNLKTESVLLATIDEHKLPLIDKKMPVAMDGEFNSLPLSLQKNIIQNVELDSKTANDSLGLSLPVVDTKNHIINNSPSKISKTVNDNLEIPSPVVDAQKTVVNNSRSDAIDIVNSLTDKIDNQLLPGHAVVNQDDSVDVRPFSSPNNINQLSLNTVVNRQPSAVSSAAPLELSAGYNEWGQTIGNRISMMMNARTGEAKIRLSPPELGALVIKISMVNSEVNVNFITENNEAGNAVHRSIAHLQDMLNENGVKLGDVNVSSESGSNAKHQKDVLEFSNNKQYVQDQEEENEMITEDIYLSDGVLSYYV